MSYNRREAVKYAHVWAYSRNPKYYDYENIGGDCTNFISQCLLAGGGVMDYTPTFGWYYTDANRKAPAWTGVVYLNNFLTRTSKTRGPRARSCTLHELQIGDIVQLAVTGNEFHHTTIVVSAAPPYRPQDILVASHSYDADYRPISTYAYKRIRCLHITSTE